MANSSCLTESLVPSWVTIVVGSLMLVFLIATSVYSYSLLTHQTKWKDKKCSAKLKSWAMDIWGRKACYLPIISHLADTTTDFAAVAEFYIIARDKTPEQCGGLNIWYIFSLSVSCMVAYRAVSSYVIYILTRSWLRVVTQFVDIELFRILYVSHKYKLSKKSSPQRLISILEAVFEAAPQALLQLIFLMKTDGLSTVIVLSVILSLFNLTSSAVSDDKMLEGFTKSGLRAYKWKEKLKTLPLLYLFRICDIPSHILCLCLFWIFIDGESLTILISIDFIVVCIIYWRTNKCTDALMGLVALPLSFGDSDDDKHPILWLCVFWFYRILWIISVNIILWIYFPKYQHHKSAFITGLWWFASLASLLKFPILLIIYKVIDGDWFYTSKERGNMPAMCEKELFSDVVELMFYIHTTPKSTNLIMTIDNKPFATLLWVIYKAATADADWSLFHTMIDKHGIDSYDENYCCHTAFHALCKYSRGVEGPQKIAIAQTFLQKADMKYLKAVNHYGESLFMIIAAHGDEFALMDLIWEKFNALCDDDEIQQTHEDEKENIGLLSKMNDVRIEYLNTIIRKRTDWSAYEGYNAMQFAVQRPSKDACIFLRKFLSFYPTQESKRDIVFRTDLARHSTLLIACVEGYKEGCFDLLFKEMKDLSVDMDDADEIIIKYLNTRVEDSYNESTMIMSALDHYDMGDSMLNTQLNIETPPISQWFFKVIDLYPTLQSKQDALKMKTKDGKDALQLCKDNNWNEKEKRKTMNMIQSILNADEPTQRRQSTANMTNSQRLDDNSIIKS